MKTKRWWLFLFLGLLEAGCMHKAKQAETVPPVVEAVPASAEALPADPPTEAPSTNRPQEASSADTLLSQKQLDALMEVICQRWDSVTPAVRVNVMGYGTGLHTLDVYLVLNTPERQQAFREQVIDSPALRFSGSTGKEPCLEVGTSDTLGVRLIPEFPSFPVGTEKVTFLLYNESSGKVLSGEHYKLAYERAGRWYWLPINSYAVDIGNITPPGGTHRFTGNLHPQVNGSRPGLYRFFTEVEIEGADVLMMAEFRLE